MSKRTVSAESVHEAGHALAAHLLGADIAYARLGPNSSGETRTTREPADPRKRAVISLAGPAATHLLCAPDPARWRREDVDRRQARLDVGNGGYLLARQTARKLLAAHLPELGRIARELARRRRLSGADVGRIMTKARRNA